MCDIGRSLQNLVNTNGGLFKSEKQAAFLSSKLVDGQHWEFHKCYNNVSKTVYDVDSEGVRRITKINKKNGSDIFTVVWDRFDSSFAEAVAAKLQKKKDRAAKKQAEYQKSVDHYEAYRAECNKYSFALNNFGDLLMNRFRRDSNLPDVESFADLFVGKSAFALSEYPLAKRVIERQKRIDDKIKAKYY